MKFRPPFVCTKGIQKCFETYHNWGEILYLIVLYAWYRWGRSTDLGPNPKKTSIFSFQFYMFILYFEFFDSEENLVNIGIKTVCNIKQTSKIISSLTLKRMNSSISLRNLGKALQKKWKFLIKFAILRKGGGLECP